jgi:hypothetical protein
METQRYGLLEGHPYTRTLEVNIDLNIPESPDVLV